MFKDLEDFFLYSFKLPIHKNAIVQTVISGQPSLMKGPIPRENSPVDFSENRV
jgi:hypothetical protein